VPFVSTFDASPLLVFSASAGAAATSGGAGMSGAGGGVGGAAGAGSAFAAGLAASLAAGGGGAAELQAIEIKLHTSTETPRDDWCM
jgi:hypothetical protein